MAESSKSRLDSPSVCVMLRSVACKSEEMKARDDSMAGAFHQSRSLASLHDCPVTSHPFLFWGQTHSDLP